MTIIALSRRVNQPCKETPAQQGEELMPAEQTIILTALPRGVDDTQAGKTQLLLSVFVSPRLKMPGSETNGGTTVLDKFKDFINWPLTLKNLHFSVELDGNKIEETHGVERDDKVIPQPDHWTALFQPTTLVQPYDFAADDLSKRTTLSYPVLNILTFIKERYGNSGAKHASPTRCTPQVLPRIDYPVIGRLEGTEWFGLITRESRNGARAQLNKQLEANRAYIAGKTPDPPVDFLQFAEFHPNTLYTSTGPKPPEKEPVNVFDFHQMVSSLSEYPHIMRMLGLIVDLKITLAAPPQKSGRIAVGLSGPGLTAKPVTPFTLYEFDAARKRFAAASTDQENSDFRDGLLKLDRDDFYGIAQVDVDGVALKTLNYVEQMVQAASNASADTPTKAPLPSLRSGGISLVRINHAAELIKTADTAAANNTRAENGEKITLEAADVLGGYRVDVRELKGNGPKGPWRSLCWRKGTYQFLNNPALLAVPFEDEGMASVAATDGPKGTDQTKPPPLKLSEMLFRWAGWSLTVPKDVCSADDMYTKAHGSDMNNSFNFRARFDLPDPNGQNAADKRLPRLRFGNRYQLRVRTVDLAGNSLSPEDPTEITTKEVVTYGRFEPVSWPTVILTTSLVQKDPNEGSKKADVVVPGKEGESVDRLVVRSQTDTDFSKQVLSERHIVPARIAQDLAETHGMFDKDQGTGLSKECFQMIAGKNGNLPDVDGDAQITLPYLPDPLAYGVTFLGLPGNDTWQVSYRPKGTEWPDLKPFRLQLLGVSAKTPLAPPEFSQQNGARVLTVRLPQAEMVRIRLSTYLGEYGQKEVNGADKLLNKFGPLMDQLGMWQWIDEWITRHGTGSSDVPQWKHIARLLILSGLHWLITPYHDLVLVHAVKQPLIAPSLGLDAQKPAEPKFATFARLSGTLTCDAKSTGKLDVLAEWKEPRDDPKEQKPHASPTQPKSAAMFDPIASGAHVFEVPINLPELPINQPELIPKQLPLVHGGKNIATVDIAQGVVTLTNPDLRQEFGDTKYRRVDYTAVATTRFREYFTPSNPQTPAERQLEQETHARVSAAQSLHVLSSARPEAPKVLYIIPAFRWERGIFNSKRHGGGLRVYMDRGWYSSGDGELLGVLLLPGASASDQPQILSDDDPHKPYVSQWGADPVFVSAGTNGLLAPENLTNPATAAQSGSGNFQTTGLSLDEMPNGLQVTVVPHTVAYDEVRRLWYSDIEINPGDSYYPFVRLALARYQPNSVAGVELSRVVLADFVQLTPERTVSLAPDASDPKKLNVTVTGPTYNHVRAAGDDIVPEGSLMGVYLERRDSESDLSWTLVDNSSFILDRLPGEAFWHKQITLPVAPGTSAPKTLRLIIREFEFLLDKQGSRTLRTVYADVMYL
jgi:hypothetical protein